MFELLYFWTAKSLRPCTRIFCISFFIVLFSWRKDFMSRLRPPGIVSSWGMCFRSGAEGPARSTCCTCLSSWHQSWTWISGLLPLSFLLSATLHLPRLPEPCWTPRFPHMTFYPTPVRTCGDLSEWCSACAEVLAWKDSLPYDVVTIALVQQCRF